LNFSLVGNDLVLLSEKAVFQPKNRILIIADLHLGKIEHFRASGIAIPGNASNHTLRKVQYLIDQHKPTKVLFLGDLFHSVMNQSFLDFKVFVQDHIAIEFILILGNHDILSVEAYSELGLSVVDDYMIDNLWLTHEPQEVIKPGIYNLAGHIHPGIRLKGVGKQSMTLPCFYFGASYGILPAFGYFTGKVNMKYDKNSTIFAIADDKIIRIPTI